MSHQIGSRTPRRDTYVGFCLYEEDEEEKHNKHAVRLLPTPMVTTIMRLSGETLPVIDVMVMELGIDHLHLSKTTVRCRPSSHQGLHP